MVLFHIYFLSISRIRRPFDSYDKELFDEGYPESSEHLHRLLSVQGDGKNETKRDTTLIDDPTLLNHTIECLKDLEVYARDRSE